MQDNLYTIDHIFAFVETEGRRLVKITRIGKYDRDKGPKTLLFNTESSISKNLNVKSTHKLKNFQDLRVFKSPKITEKAETKIAVSRNVEN